MSTVSSTTRSLTKYRSKRDFSKTAEPAGNKGPVAAGHSYLIQKHAARRLHYDFRLELDGVLKSWAVTRGQVSIPLTSGSRYMSRTILSTMGCSRELFLRGSTVAVP